MQIVEREFLLMLVELLNTAGGVHGLEKLNVIVRDLPMFSKFRYRLLSSPFTSIWNKSSSFIFLQGRPLQSPVSVI